MVEKIPEQPEENLPDWEELKEEDLDPGIREDLLELARIDEKEIWSDKELSRRLQGEPTFAPSLWLGLRLLLESHGLTQQKDVLERFDELSDSFTGQKKASIEEQIRDIRELRKYLSSLGLNEKDLSAKETLRRAYLGVGQAQSEEALKVLKQLAEENPSFRKALEMFDKEAKSREGRG